MLTATTRSIGQLTNCKLAAWNREAALNFARHGSKGGKLVRQLWANGQTMVGPEGGLPNQFIPLAQAVKIFRDGWKIYT